MMESSALHNDLYQLTMAYGYWKNGLHEQPTCFHQSFRTLPFGGGFAVACGQGLVREWLENFSFSADDCAYLATLEGADNKPLFDKEFLQFLQALRLNLEISAVAEGEIVFGHQPLLRVCGPVLQCQLIETALLTLMNFSTLIATKAARVCLAAGAGPVLEFGARRAQGLDGALTASRAAYIGGCAATSNVLAGKTYQIPCRGTHAHSWVMLFNDELEAFRAYARALPNNCTFLVDTYDTLEGVRHAIEVGHELRADGHELAGIRLDSGDLAYLSIHARQLLDHAGFETAKIVASNDLEEHVIENLKSQGARIDVWGVGTHLVTGGEQSALGGVYKLSAVRDENNVWQPRLKLSEQTIKTSTPGRLQVRRYMRDGKNVADAIYDIDKDLVLESAQARSVKIVHPDDAMRRVTVERNQVQERDLLQPFWNGGAAIHESEPVSVARARVLHNLDGFHGTIKRVLNPHAYPAGLLLALHERKSALILAAREKNVPTQ